MKQYTRYYIKGGVINHVETSDAPLPDTVAIDVKDHSIIEDEIEVDSFMRGRVMIDSHEMENNKVTLKPSAAQDVRNNIKSRKGIVR